MGFRYYDPLSGRWLETTANDPPAGYLGYPWTPISQLPHKVRDLVKFPLAATLMSAQPFLGYTPVSDHILIQGRRGASEFTAISTSISNVNSGNVNYRQFARSGSGTQKGFGRHWGPGSFHHILDPSGGIAGWTPIFHDDVKVTFGSAAAFAALGFVNVNSADDDTSYVGAIWKCSKATGYWTSGLYDGTSAPSNTVHETTHSGLTTTTARRLSIVIDAASKSVLWYADYTLVDTYTPAAVLGQMGAIPRIGYYGMAANGASDMAIMTLGGSNPRLFSMKRAA